MDDIRDGNAALHEAVLALNGVSFSLADIERTGYIPMCAIFIDPDTLKTVFVYPPDFSEEIALERSLIESIVEALAQVWIDAAKRVTKMKRWIN